jgi:hypothetical protein
MRCDTLVPLLAYKRIRAAGMSDRRWDTEASAPQEQMILAISVRHSLHNDDGYACAGVVIHHYRDFCGGLQAESGFVDVRLEPDRSYSSWRIDGSCSGEFGTSTLPHINDLVEEPPTTLDELETLLEKSVAAAVVTHALSEGRCLIHFTDKEGGRLHDIMRHIKDSELEAVLQSNSYLSGGKIQPFLPTALANNEVKLLLQNPIARREIIETEWTETPKARNTNSGNDVRGYIVSITDPNLNESVSDAYCDGCGEYWSYEGYADCPECGNDIFGDVRDGRMEGGRRLTVNNALASAFKQPGSWKFMPHTLWRIG